MTSNDSMLPQTAAAEPIAERSFLTGHLLVRTFHGSYWVLCYSCAPSDLVGFLFVLGQLVLEGIGWHFWEVWSAVGLFALVGFVLCGCLLVRRQTAFGPCKACSCFLGGFGGFRFCSLGEGR